MLATASFWLLETSFQKLNANYKPDPKQLKRQWARDITTDYQSCNPGTWLSRIFQCRANHNRPILVAHPASTSSWKCHQSCPSDHEARTAGSFAIWRLRTKECQRKKNSFCSSFSDGFSRFGQFLFRAIPILSQRPNTSPSQRFREFSAINAL